MVKSVFCALICTLVFLGCSSKEYFEPEETIDSLSLSKRFDSALIDVNAQSATMDDGTIVTKEGIDPTRFPQGYRFVFKNDDWALAVRTGGSVFAVKNEFESKTLELSKTVATLALKDDLLAVIFSDNELALYEFSTGTLLFKEPASESAVVDMRVSPPRFLNDLVLFPTLDGKIVIVNASSRELVRTIIVSSEQYFNNITYFNVVDDTLYAATPSKLYSLGEQEKRVDIQARSVIVNEEGIWAATKQGELVHLSHSLEILKTQKFPFAHFLGLVVSDERIYAAEKEEYIISCDKELEECFVYDFDLESGFFFTSEDGFYFDNVYLQVR